MTFPCLRIDSLIAMNGAFFERTPDECVHSSFMYGKVTAMATATASAATMNTAVGVFSTRAQAQSAVQGLRAAGFSDSSIGVLSQSSDTGTGVTNANDRSGLNNDPTATQWEEGAGVGAAAGAVTGTGLGLAVAAGLMSPIGPLVAGGALIALLASAGAGAAVGTMVGGLVGLGIPEDDANYYEGELKSGRTLVTVDAGSRHAEAQNIIRQHGGLLRSSTSTY